MTRRAAILCGVMVAFAVVGCGGDGLPPVAAVSKDGAAAGSAFPSVTADTKEEMPSPFGDPTSKAVGGREVIEKPTLADIFAPSPMAEMSWGRADAPVTIVQYASLTCQHCRHFHAETFPELKRAYIDTGKVRYVLREFPIGRTSGMATIALRCAKPEKYLELYSKYMEQQNNWVSQEVRLDPIFAVAQQVGMKRAEFDKCRENQGMIEQLKWVKDRGRKLGIVGTPNYFVGDQLIKKELTLADIRALVDARTGAASGATTGAAAAASKAN